MTIPASFALLSLGGTTNAAPAPPPVGWSAGPSLPGAFGARWDYAVSYLPATDQVVVFGGAPDAYGGTWKSDTWLYSVATDSWSQGPAAPSALTARGGAAMAYDPALGKVVLFGGTGTDWPPFSDTWLFDGSNWTQGPSAPAGMGPRVGARMAYMDSLGKMVLVGGSGTKPYADTWLFDGASWTPGPAAPAAMGPRTFFGMAYDASAGKLVVAGGTGGKDLWLFDGSTWTAGPTMPDALGPLERLGIAYDPQLQAEVFFGGIGPIGNHGDAWLYRPATGSWIQASPGSIKPSNRFDASMAWVPTKDALMLIGGETDQNDGTVLSDTWFFRDVPPQQVSLAITPSNPDMATPVTMVGGGQTGGYGGTSSEFAWYVNGVLVPGATGDTLTPVYKHGDQIVAQIRMHDSLDLYGPWVSSPSVTVIDRPPVITLVGLNPASPVLTDTIETWVTGADPDGDAVSYSYRWTVNGQTAGGDTPNLDPAYFQANDLVAVTVTPTDALGMTGQPVPSPTVSIAYNLVVDPAIPGGNPRTQGKGYAPYETVDIRIDSPSGPVLASWQADAGGGWFWNNVALPAALAGGTHMMYGTGRTSGKVGQGPVQITPGATITPSKFPAGSTVVGTGVGFVPGETVSVSFPDQAPTTAVADATGNVSATLVAPPSPSAGGDVTFAAPSGTLRVHFSVTPVLNAPATAVPGTTGVVSVTGFAAQELVTFGLDAGGAVGSGVTDRTGSLSTTVLFTGFFGPHTLSATGGTSLVSLSRSVPYPATLSLSPTSGPRGTVVTISSGPGWKPQSTLTFKVGSRTLTPKTTDQTGSVNFQYTISSVDPLGALVIKLYSSGLNQTATGTFTVTG